MTQVGQHIENPVTGQTIIFRATGQETNGEVFQAEGIFRPGGFAGVLHYHPFQKERFEVMEGTACFKVGHKQVQLGPGETIVVPTGQRHTFWNAGQDEMRVIFEFRPALPATVRFYEFYFGLARVGKARKNGLPSIWQIALQVDEFADHVRMANPPWWIQRVIFALLRPVALLIGYRRLDFTGVKVPQ